MPRSPAPFDAIPPSFHKKGPANAEPCSCNSIVNLGKKINRILIGHNYFLTVV